MEEEQEESTPAVVLAAQNNADLNPILFKSVFDQQNDRLKFLTIVNSLVEELSEAEQATAKSLNRTGSGFMQGRNDQFAILNGPLEELLKFITQFEGRAHVQVANSMSNVFSKALPEYGKVSKKKLASIWQRIGTKLEDLKKAKTAHHRNVENYLRMVKEAEELIRLRDSAEELNERLTEGERESSTLNRSEAAAVDEKDKFNLGFSKMLSKISANDKKPSERITELLRDIPVEERQLIANSKRLVAIRHELITDIARGYTDVFNIETGRIHVFKDAFANVYEAYDNFNKRTIDTAEQLTKQIIDIQFDNILQLPTELKSITDCHALTFLQTEEWTHDFGESHAQVPTIAVKIEKVVELYEIAISCMQRTHQLFNEVSDVERSRSRLFRRLLDKFDSSTTSDLLASEVQAEYPPAKLNKVFIGEINELLSFRQGTASLILHARQLGEVSTRSTEHCHENVCRQLEIMQKRAVIYRKDLRDGYSAFVKQLEVNYANVAKCRGKLSKTRALLKERYATIKQVKTTAGVTSESIVSSPDMSIGKSLTAAAGGGCGAAAEDDGSVVSPPTTAAAASAAAGSSVSTIDHNNHSSTSTTTITGSLGATTATATTTAGGGGPESNSLYRRSTMKNIQNLSSTFRTASKLKQVVGLETITDRMIRIENQIMTLEKEEKELSVMTQRALDDMSHFLLTSSTDLTNRMNVAKQGLLTEFENFRMILTSILDWNKEKSSLISSSLFIFKRCLDSYQGIDINQPFYLTAFSDRMVIPEVELFEPLRSEIIEEERKNMRTQQLANLSPSTESISRRPSYVIEAAAEQGSDHQLRLDAIMREEEEEANIMLHDHHPIDDNDKEEKETEQRPSTETKDSHVASPVNEVMDAVISSPSSPMLQHVTTGSFAVMNKESSQVACIVERVDGGGGGDSDDHDGDHGTASAAVSTSVVVTDVASTIHVTTITDTISVIRETSSSSINGSTSAATSTSTKTTRAAPPAYPHSTGNTPAKISNFEMELKKFGLDNTDKILESFSCAIYPKKGMLTHGRLFITQHFIAFSGWPETRILLPLYRVVKLEKALTLKYIPNAITVVLQDDPEEYFFGSFIDRDQCYTLMKSLSEIEKRIAEINMSEGIAVEERRLEYGYQTTSSLFAAQWTGTQPLPVPSTTTAAIVAASHDEHEQHGLHHEHHHDMMMATPPRTLPRHMIAESMIKPTFSEEDDNESDGLAEDDDVALVASVPRPLALATAPDAPAPIMHADMAKLNKVRNLFKDFKISPLSATKTLPFSPQAFYRSSFLHCQSYRSYMDAQKDENIICSEWEPHLDPVTLQPKVIPEDVTKLPFTYRRPFTFDHPRTTMLMFGPKMAPAKQEQFLYLLTDDDNSVNNPDQSYFNPAFRRKPIYGAVILLLFEFEGIPMGDVFKVLQYFLILPTGDQATATTCDVSVGVLLHFRKSSMFRGQIISGTQDEMMPQVANWLEFAENKAKQDVTQGFVTEEAGENVTISEQLTISTTRSALLTPRNQLLQQDAVAATSRPASMRQRRGTTTTVEDQQAVNAIVKQAVETAVQSLKEQFGLYLLWRDRVIKALLGMILILLLAVLYVLRGVNGKLAALTSR